MEVTEEMRAAVLAAECDRHGHLIDIDEAISADPDLGDPNEHTVTIRSREADTIPHIRCKRCPTVWLIVQGAAGYDAAEAELNDRLQPKHRRKLRRERRRERAAAERAEAERLAAEQAQVQETVTVAPIVAEAFPIPAPAPQQGGDQWN